jgi:GrpB-like predicted nucleotidyltransferase (UPF0157 family)/pimeloyl-ACP methyl ester carboxylesterase
VTAGTDALAAMGFVEAGEGPTVVALHGGLVGGRLTFGPVLAQWSRRLRVLVPDRRGFERTPRPADGTIEDQARDLLAFVAAHGRPDPWGGHPRAHVVALSFGGVVALTALQLDPSVFRSVTVVEAPAVTLCGEDPEVAAWREELQRTYDRISHEPEPVLRRFLARSDPGSLEPLLRLLRSGDPGVTPKHEELKPWETSLSPEGIGGTGVPALVVSGGESPPIFRTIGAHTARVLGADHHVVEGAGHAVHLAGRRVLDALRAFIAAAEAPATVRTPIELHAPDPAWAEAFRAERDEIAQVLGHRALAIEHIGSTAVPGLEAKPVIDILVGVDGMDTGREAAARLCRSGYAWWRDNPEDEDFAYLLRAADGRRLHHVKIAPRGGPRWHDWIAFRDALRRDPRLRDDYAELKRRLAGANRGDREAYTDGKGDFVAAALAGRPTGA